MMIPTFDSIEARRAALAVTQSRLCRRADVHPVTYSRIKRGQTRSADTATLQALADALDALAGEAKPVSTPATHERTQA
jgi:transcriptional regulator with XRE-family HTH domain